MEYPQGIKDNLSILSEDELEIVKKLISDDQAHLFDGWKPAGEDDEQKHGFFSQMRDLEKSYPGGITAYTRNARVLLTNSRLNVSPFTGLHIEDADPDLAISLLGYGLEPGFNDKIKVGTKTLSEIESIGLREVSYCAFVLVAGGLGERLGYKGIKIALSSECLTHKSFIERYCESISDLDAHSASLLRAEDIKSPQERPRAELAIMTSEDTHARTEALLRARGYFGLGEDRVLLVRQGRVACLSDEAGHLARSKESPYRVEAKPHGHGDVHALLHSSGLLERWVSQGKRWVVLFQDTNALFFRTLPALLGVSAASAFEVNNAAVPRKHREAIGALCKLADESGAVRYPLLNVEYNLIPAMLPGGCEPEPEAGKYSPYPGNINEIVLRLEPYARVLGKTGGLTPEFVNPKYADSQRTKFASAARLECMMQDYPRSLPPESRIGYTLLAPWLAFSPVKNSLPQARDKWLHGIPAFGAGTGEFDQYAANARLLEAAGVKITGGSETVMKRSLGGIEYAVGPMVLYSCAWAPTFEELKRKVSPEGVEISRTSALVIEGESGDVVIKKMSLDGALWIRAVKGAKVVIDGLVVRNRGVKVVEIGNEGNKEDPDVDDSYEPVLDEVIRGYYIKKLEVKELVFDNPGEYVVN